MGTDLKIVFLDVDGVLNSQDWYLKRPTMYKMDDIDNQYPMYEFSPDHVAVLNKITDETGAKIVFSSSWRHGRTLAEIKTLLSSVGVTGEIIDVTPYMSHVDGYTIPRGCDIEKWLHNNEFRRINWSAEEQNKQLEQSKIKQYVILDDDSDMLFNQREHFVQTTGTHGLDQEAGDKAIEILKKTVVELYYPFESPYCPACGACGEDPCCSGAACKKLECHYGETYNRDYRFNNALVSMAFDLMEELKAGKFPADEAHIEYDKRWHENWDKIYKNEE